MGIFYQCAAGSGRPASSTESPGKQSRLPRTEVRLAGRPVGCARLRRNRLRSDPIGADSGRGWGHRPDCTVVLGGALIVADGATTPVPIQQFRWSEPAHPLPLCRIEWRSLLSPIEFDTGARLFADPSGRRTAALHFVNVPAVTLVWRTS